MNMEGSEVWQTAYTKGQLQWGVVHVLNKFQVGHIDIRLHRGRAAVVERACAIWSMYQASNRRGLIVGDFCGSLCMQGIVACCWTLSRVSCPALASGCCEMLPSLPTWRTCLLLNRCPALWGDTKRPC